MRRACVIALGDSFHDGGGPARLADADRAHARARCSAAATGSGSPAITIPSRPTDIGGAFGGDAGDRRADVPPSCRQRDAPRARSPAICIRWRACRSAAAPVSRRCFATDGKRMVMPAFGAYAGGLNVRDARLRRRVRHARLHRAYAGRGAALCLPGARAAWRTEPQSRRNTTLANQPVSSASSAVARP